MQYDENAEKYGYEGEMTPMKCDELKAEQWLDYGGEPRECYPRVDVDEAIAELKDLAENVALERDDNQTAIDELQAENAELKAANKLLKEHIANGDVSRITWIDEVIELKQKLHDAEMRADLAEAANTEYRIDLKNIKDNLAKHARNQYHKHNRQTLRALWLARANRALEKIAWFKLWNASISTMNPEDGARQEYDKWMKNLGKFLKKAEEYK